MRGPPHTLERIRSGDPRVGPAQELKKLIQAIDRAPGCATPRRVLRRRDPGLRDFDRGGRLRAEPSGADAAAAALAEAAVSPRPSCGPLSPLRKAQASEDALLKQPPRG